MGGLNDLGAVRAFIAVAQAGSFARAADAIGLTRSAVGKAVARLEDQLGTRLLQRSTRRVGLTTEGELLLDRCAELLAELDEIEAIVTRDRTEPMGILRLTVPDAYGRLRILPVLDRYLLAWPKLRAEVSFSDKIADLVEDGYDLAVRIGATPSETQLITRVIARTATILCAAPGYLDVASTPSTPEDLALHRRLAFGNGRRSLPWRLSKPDGSDVSITSPPHLLFDSADAIREATLLGHGVAYLPDFLIEDDVRAGRLLPLLASYETETLPISAIYPSRRHLSNKVRLFLDLLSSSG